MAADSEADHSAVKRYFPIETNLLIELSPLKSDVYIRLSRTKFLKLFREGDVFDHIDLVKYKKDKGVEHLYVLNTDVDSFLKRFTEDLEQKIENRKGKPADMDQARATYGQVHKTVQDVSEKMGVTEELEELTKVEVAETVRSIKYDWKLSRLLKELALKGGYIAEHSYAVGYVASLILNRTQWRSEYNVAKMVYAALLHDIVLSADKVAIIQTLKEVEKNEGMLTSQERQEIKLHPVRALEKAKQFSTIPHDVDTIILQHHERPGGSGFPRGLIYSQINPLAGVFMIAHELVLWGYRTKDQGKVEQWVEDCDFHYEGFFEEILEAVLEQEKNFRNQKPPQS